MQDLVSNVNILSSILSSTCARCQALSVMECSSALTPPPSSRTYQHQPLNHAKQEIRLIKLLPPSKSTPDAACISCEISHHSLKDGPSTLPQYTAISWTWGHEPSIHSILLNGSPFPVRQSLHDCLFAMSEAGSYIDTFLWADQLCIHQANIEERNSQVQLMHAIYTRTERVCAWLGASTSDSARGLALLSDFQSWCMTVKTDRSNLGFLGSEGTDRPTLAFLDTEQWQPLLTKWMEGQGETEAVVDQLFDILERPYWTRIWIVQELLCAQSVELLCGTSRCRFDHDDLPIMRYFHQVYQYVEASARYMYGIDPDGHYDKMGRVRLATTLLSYKGLEHEPWFSLSNALQLSLDRKCEDPRDRVFGLQAIVESTHRVWIDYTLSKEEVFRNARRAMESYPVDNTPYVIKSLREEMGISEDLEA